MKRILAQVESVYRGDDGKFSKSPQQSIELDLQGIRGDRHRSIERIAWEGDKQKQGTIRRNERQWSAVSVEELQQISEDMNLKEPLSASCVGANICLRGVPQLSRLPKGTLLRFPSGAELVVEEYNPPCHEMGQKIAADFVRRDGQAQSSTAFSKAAKLSRGIVGVVEVAGVINAGDEVTITIYETPAWLKRD